MTGKAAYYVSVLKYRVSVISVVLSLKGAERESKMVCYVVTLCEKIVLYFVYAIDAVCGNKLTPTLFPMAAPTSICGP